MHVANGLPSIVASTGDHLRWLGVARRLDPSWRRRAEATRRSLAAAVGEPGGRAATAPPEGLSEAEVVLLVADLIEQDRAALAGALDDGTPAPVRVLVDRLRTDLFLVLRHSRQS